jgi:ABC-2 type transport system permease protein
VSPLLALARSDIVRYLSNRRALLVTLAAPILIAAFFGAVLGDPQRKPSRVPIAIVDLDASTVSASIVGAIRADAAVAVDELAEPAAIEAVRKGKVRAAAVIPAGFGAAAARALLLPEATRPEVVIHYDPSQSIAVSIVKGVLAEQVMKAVTRAAFSPESGTPIIADVRDAVQKSERLDAPRRRDLLALFDSVERVQQPDAAGAGPAGATPAFSMPFATREQEVTSGAGRKYNSYAHAFAGMSVQFILFMGIELGMAVLLMRRQGLWQRLRAAPVSKRLLLGSRILSGTVIALVLLAGIYAAAIAAFGVRIEGSVVGFAAVAVAFAVLTATFGLLIAAVGRTPEATRGIAIVATLLLVMLGGAWVPTFVFPEWLQTATLVVPTRWAIDGLAAMTWRGLRLDAALAPVAVLLGFSALFGWIAVRRFDWEE